VRDGVIVRWEVGDVSPAEFVQAARRRAEVAFFTDPDGDGSGIAFDPADSWSNPVFIQFQADAVQRNWDSFEEWQRDSTAHERERIFGAFLGAVDNGDWLNGGDWTSNWNDAQDNLWDSTDFWSKPRLVLISQPTEVSLGQTGWGFSGGGGVDPLDAAQGIGRVATESQIFAALERFAQNNPDVLVIGRNGVILGN